MRRQAKAGVPKKQPAPSKKDELLVALRQRDALWQLLDNIDTLDDACREDDGRFRKLSRVHLKQRFEIYNPEGN